MKKVILAVMVLSLILASCKRSETTKKEISNYINVNANMGSLTRATNTAFETNDQISVYAWTGASYENAVTSTLFIDNSINTFGGSAWSSSPQMKWKDMSVKHYFVAIYPKLELTEFKEYEFTLTGDKAHDDLLFAVNNEGMNGNAVTSVPLVFNHSQTKLIVNLSFRTNLASPTVTSVTTFGKNIAIVDFINKSTIVKPTATASEIKIPNVSLNTKYESILVPQTIKKITVKIGNRDYVYENTAGIGLEQGKVQTIGLIVGTSSGSSSDITLGPISIKDWDDGQVITNGEAT